MNEFRPNNLGLIPLAGICTYDEACKAGISVDDNVTLLKRYVYIKSQLTRIIAAHLPGTPEWEFKCALSLHIYLDAEHSALLRKRVSEMREPPLELDKVPDEKLEAYFQELIRSAGSLELAVGIYQVTRRALIDAYEKHMAQINPLVDYPTRRLLNMIKSEEEEMLAWGEQAAAAFRHGTGGEEAAAAWEAHLTRYLAEAGGIAGDRTAPQAAIQAPRSNGQPYEMSTAPRRDDRFVDPFNCSAKIDDYYTDESLPVDARIYALLYKRLREMDVPEWMGPIIYKTEGKPWAYYLDMSRQLWDECRHAMYGEVGLYKEQIPFYRYPIDMRTCTSINANFSPLQAHGILWSIEQSLMPGKTGKRMEWELACASDHELMKVFQDYDWADEVLHAQIGRRWLLPEFAGYEELNREARRWREENWAYRDRLNAQSGQQVWWGSFLADIRGR